MQKGEAEKSKKVNRVNHSLMRSALAMYVSQPRSTDRSPEKRPALGLALRSSTAAVAPTELLQLCLANCLDTCNVTLAKGHTPPGAGSAANLWPYPSSTIGYQIILMESKS